MILPPLPVHSPERSPFPKVKAAAVSTAVDGGGDKGGGGGGSSAAPKRQQSVLVAVSQSDIGIQTGLLSVELDESNGQEEQDEHAEYSVSSVDENLLLTATARQQQQHHHHQRLSRKQHRHCRSISLDDILGSSYIHEAATGERIIISRGWPTSAARRSRGRRVHASSSKANSRRRSSMISNVSRSVRRVSAINHSRQSNNQVKLQQQKQISSGRSIGLSAEQKRALLMEFLQQSTTGNPTGGRRASNVTVVLGKELELESSLRITNQSPPLHAGRKRTPSPLISLAESPTDPSQSVQQRAETKGLDMHRLNSMVQASPIRQQQVAAANNNKAMIVRYDLPVHLQTAGPIALRDSV